MCRGSTDLLRRYNRLYTSGFVDDANHAMMFAANWPGKGDAGRVEAQ